MNPWDTISPFDVAALRAAYRAAQPTPFVCIDGFLRPEFAREAAHVFPSYQEGRRTGHEFSSVYEFRKTQITDPARFPEPIATLNAALASPELVAALSEITGIPDLLPDPKLLGAGIHMMARGGRLDVHVDIISPEQIPYYRRVNVIVYLNEYWDPAWGGHFEFWDRGVRVCQKTIEPAPNRCLFFNTTTESFHGVTRIRCPRGQTRNSFATFYYTATPPPGWNGVDEGTRFRSRPNEWWREAIFARAERLRGRAWQVLRDVKHTLTGRG